MKRLVLALIPLLLTSVLAYSTYEKWGVINIIVTNQPPTIEYLKLLDNNLTEIPKGSLLKLADAAGNLLPYYIEINVTDPNTLNDIRYIKVVIYKTGATSPSETSYFNFTYYVQNNTIAFSNLGEFNVTVDAVPNLDNTNGIFRFKVIFPKTAESVGSYDWNVEVYVADASSTVKANLSNWFDFDYYAEYIVTPNLTLYAPAGQTINAYTWLNISVINAPTKIEIYSNHSYMLKDGTEYTAWPLNTTVNIIVDGITYPFGTTPAVYNISGPARNVNKRIIWNIKVPLTVPTGNYSFYYFIKLSRS